MRKFLFALAIFCMASVALSVNAQSSSPKAGGKKTVLKVIANVDNSTSDGQDWSAIVDEFRADNPDIDVQDVTVYAEAYHQKARIMLAAQDYPDVAYIWPDARGVYFKEAGQLINNKPFMDLSFYDMSAIPAQGPKGEIWEVPYGASNFTTVLFANTDILKKYNLPEPKTYADLVAMVEPLKKAGIMVISMDGSEGWVWNSCLMSGVVARMGGSAHWISEAVAGKHKFTDPAFVKSLAIISSMMKDGILPQSTMVTDYGTALTNFLTGKAAFMLDGQWRANGVEDPAFQKVVKLLPIPSLPGEAKGMANSIAAAITAGFGITKAGASSPAKLDAAKRFLKAIYAPAWVEKRWRNGTIVAPTTKIATPGDLSPITKEKTRFARAAGPLTDVLDSYLPTTANDALNTGMQNIALGKATPEQVAAEVESIVRAKK